MDIHDLSGRHALVTGAGSGIGAATAVALAERGANLVICDVREEGLEATAERVRKLGRDARTRLVDVSDREAMRIYSEEVNREIGRVPSG